MHHNRSRKAKGVSFFREGKKAQAAFPRISQSRGRSRPEKGGVVAKGAAPSADRRGDGLVHRKQPRPYQQRPKFNTCRLVNAQHVNRSSANGCFADKRSSLPSKMIVPMVLSRVIEGH